MKLDLNWVDLGFSDAELEWLISEAKKKGQLLRIFIRSRALNFNGQIPGEAFYLRDEAKELEDEGRKIIDEYLKKRFSAFERAVDLEGCLVRVAEEVTKEVMKALTSLGVKIDDET